MRIKEVLIISVALIIVLSASGCTSQNNGQNAPANNNQVNTALQELKSDAQNLNSLDSSYMSILTDLNSGASAQSSAQALTYYNLALGKSQSLNDKPLENYIDAIIAKLENGQNALQEYLTTLAYMSTIVENRCIALSNKISHGTYPQNIVNANSLFISKNQQLNAISQDIANMLNAQSETLRNSYASSALTKAQEFGDDTLTNIVDSIVSDVENNNLVLLQSHALGYYFYIVGLELNGCQSLANTITSS